MNRISTLLVFIWFPAIGYGQEFQPLGVSYAQPMEKTKKAKITVQAFDGVNYRANLVSIGYDYLLLDAKKFNSPAKLRPYYMRPEGDYYRIDIEYIKSATMSRGRSLGVSTFRGTLLGIVVAGLVTISVLKEEIFFDSFGEWAITTGVIVGLGTSAGFLSGLFMRKKVMINGNPHKLYKLNEFYNP